MKLAPRTTAAALAVLSTAGVSTFALGVAPAVAVPSDGCGTGDLVAPGICEQIFTGDGTFTPTATTTKLEVLLVGAGGNGTGRAEDAAAVPATTGYAAAGGGGEVEIVDFSGSTNPVAITFPAATIADNTVTSGAAVAGDSGDGDVSGTEAYGGSSSGSGQTGATVPLAIGAPGAAGGAGDGGGTTDANGGAGTVVSTIAVGGSLFAGDTRCFGGGGAATAGALTGVPAAGCGGGSATVAARANSGGGGGAAVGSGSGGADGVAIVRWNAGLITLSFSANGHGTAPAAQSIVAGMAATTPPTPTADGFEFTGWYTDASLATLADFSRVNSSTTFVAGWRAALPATGSEPNPVAFGSAIAALVAGAGILALGAYRRRRQAD